MMRKYISEHNKMLINQNRLTLLEKLFDSFKDLGKKYFEFTKIESKELLDK